MKRVYNFIYNPNLWTQWDKVYLNPLETQIQSLADWIKYFNPAWNGNATVGVHPTEEETYSYDSQASFYDGTSLNYRYGFQSSNDSSYLALQPWDDIKNKPLNDLLASGDIIHIPAGRQVFSIVCPINGDLSIRELPSSYIIIPRSDGGYFVPRNVDNELVFIYEKNAVDRFGQKVPLGWHVIPARYYLAIDQSTSVDSTALVINNISTIVTNVEESSNPIPWTNLFPLQSILTTEDGEEVFADVSTSVNQTEVDNTLTTNYTITRTNNTSFGRSFKVVVY